MSNSTYDDSGILAANLLIYIAGRPQSPDRRKGASGIDASFL